MTGFVSRPHRTDLVFGVETAARDTLRFDPKWWIRKLMAPFVTMSAESIVLGQE